jgi:hypothetical protein
VVADTLSRMPGSELLTSLELHSLSHTLGIKHSKDLPAKMVGSEDCVTLFMSGIISINERSTFRK